MGVLILGENPYVLLTNLTIVEPPAPHVEEATEGKATMLYEFQAHLRRQKLSSNTIKLRMFYLTKFEIFCDPATATTEDIEQFIDDHQYLADQTQNSIISTLKVFYKWAFYKHLVAEDPMYYIPNVRVIRKESRIASEDAINTALENGTRDDQAMIRLGAENGLRIAEIASLHISSRDGVWLTVKGKGGKIRRTKINPELAELLDSIERHGMRRGYYFPGRSDGREGHLHPSTAWRRIRRLLAMNPHSLRHRAGTVVYIGSGKDIRLTQEFLGHTNVTTTQIYVHNSEDAMEDAAGYSRIMPQAA